MLLSFNEIADMVFMSLIVGFIFMDWLEKFRPKEDYDPLKASYGFNWNSLLFSAAIVAPAIILHELAHKFLAMSFGLTATFQAAYFYLALGVLMKFMFGFAFFVPAYVSILGSATNIQYGLVAFAGPLMNAILWGVCALIVKKKLVKRKYIPGFFLASKINMFLFVFNMLPIPGFDGSKVFSALLGLF